MSTDAIVLLKQDHKEIRRLFREFQQAGKEPTARKAQLVDGIIEALTVHTYIENEVMYPRVRELLPDLEEDVLESYEEHHVADLLVVELANMKTTDERFDAKTTVLSSPSRTTSRRRKRTGSPRSAKDSAARHSSRSVPRCSKPGRRRRPGPPSQVL